MTAIVDQPTGSGTSAPPPELSARAPSARAARHFVTNPTAVVGIALVSSLSLAAAGAPWLAFHDPYEVQVSRRLAPPSRAFPLGTDELGRDVLARLLYGGRTSLGYAVIAAVAITLIGVTIGMLSAYCRGPVDMLLGRVIDVMLCFPTFLLALAVTGVLGRGLRSVVVAVVLVGWAGFARLVRSLVLAEEERPYIDGARAIGASHPRVLVRHLLPHILGPLLTFISVEIGGLLLVMSAFSFLGLGVQPPFPEWGAMVAEARDYVSVAPHMIIGPGAAIFLVVLGCNLVADGLRDTLDPTSRRSRRER